MNSISVRQEELRWSSESKARLREERRKKALAMRADGFQLARIAERLGVSGSCVSKLVKR